ncbi:hypothetical protein [Paralysiella testudinis]|uniref:Uncharacterized protein n=1 Tax=Paralysiella testudinis TaxID=2809020 RepID=A0A892ZDC9_9NEIS|nr:hypothetical protein [Paralysiella testudinis]QRQ80640.1 hypothetical protein JQU52_07615 [Paralysiella testudinis]
MQSSWSISYFGGYSGIMLKKLERVGRFVAQEVEMERLLINDEKIEHASFIISHEAESWPSLVMDVLSMARRLMPEWSIILGQDSMRGSIGSILSAYQAGYKLPASGLRSIQWEATADQKYTRLQWLSGSPDRW